MYVNLEKAKEEFYKYTENYDLTNRNIEIKRNHSLRVMKISKEIAEQLNLSEEQIEIATLIGLLHDIARFEQYTQYRTFNDFKSFDHGDYALKILDEKIRRFIDKDNYDEIIKVAIRNHNKYEIEKGLTEEQLLYAKIIRDADKIDIFYEATELFWKDKEEIIGKGLISEKIYKQFLNRNIIKREKNEKTQEIDYVITIIALIFDINFKESYSIIRKENYINKILDRFNFKNECTKDKIQRIRIISNTYIEKDD